MARWIGGTFLDCGKMNIQGFTQSGNAAALARYVDILRKEYRDAATAKDRQDALTLGKLAQAALVRIGGEAAPKAGWADRAAVIYSEK